MGKAFGMIFLTVVFAIGVTAVNQNGRRTAIDLSAKAILSDEDYEAFNDPQAAQKQLRNDLQNSDAMKRALEVQRQYETNRNWNWKR